MDRRIPLAKKIYVEKGMPNENILVIGATGSGKTTSVSEPRLLHSYEGSLVVPVSKRALVSQYAPMLKARGYKVLELNMAKPELSTCGYDALKGLKTENDILNMAELLYGDIRAQGEDIYWVQASINVIAALIGYTKCNHNMTMQKLISTYKELGFTLSGLYTTSTLDNYFWGLAEADPESPWPRLFDSIHVAPRTASCIISMVSAALSPFLTSSFATLFAKPALDIAMLGKEKTALFVITSPASTSMTKYLSVFYSQLFGILFSEAEANGGALEVPVHVICDDLVGCKIPGLDRYISLFRAAGISTTICLQSIAQLSTLYTPTEAATIMDNCSTQLFLGSINYDTCRYFSLLTDLPLSSILKLGIGKCICIRAGHSPVLTDRYATYEDPIYIEAFRSFEK